MKYACMIYYDEYVLNALGSRARDALAHEAIAFCDELHRNGHLVVATDLEGVAAAATVRSRGGRISARNGPAAATRQQLEGFVLIEARDLNEAIQIASRLPSGRLGCVEVRPIASPGRASSGAPAPLGRCSTSTAREETT